MAIAPGKRVFRTATVKRANLNAPNAPTQQQQAKSATTPTTHMHASSNPLIPATLADAAWYADHGLHQQFDPAGALASTTQLRALLDAEAPLHCAEERARREDVLGGLRTMFQEWVRKKVVQKCLFAGAEAAAKEGCAEACMLLSGSFRLGVDDYKSFTHTHTHTHTHTLAHTHTLKCYRPFLRL